MTTRGDFDTLRHDPLDPNPWLALYLNSLQLDETIAIYVARILEQPHNLVRLNNKHPLVPESTLRAGHRLVLHGLASKMLYELPVRETAMTPFRNEKNSNWEGAYRVPAMISNEMVAHHDWLPTLLAMAGDAQVKDKLLKGYRVGAVTYKMHLDGDNLVPYLTGQAAKSPRESFLYVNDDQQLTGLRYDNCKFVFMEQRAQGTLRIWAEPFVTLRFPKLFNLRTDKYERADVISNMRSPSCPRRPSWRNS